MKKALKFILCTLLIASLIICAGFIGYKTGIDSAIEEEKEYLTLSLPISVEVDYDAGYTLYSAADLNNHYENGIAYLNMSSVVINIDGTDMDLGAAIRDGHITVDEILALARIDASNGYCTEVYESVNGLSEFIYQYPSYDLSLIYDVFEAPDGNQYLIKRMVLYPPNGHKNSGFTLHITGEDGSTKNLKREDWGLSFEVTEVTSEGITLNCTHLDGQQIGTLLIEGFYIAQPSNTAFEHPNVQIASISILSNGSTEVTLDWSETYGSLSCGDYTLTLDVCDVYDPSELHPLMKNFTDTQSYNITFTIP